MAHPYLGAKGMEAGDNSEWDSESDTDAKLSFPHITQMYPYGVIPYRGAYSMLVDVGVAQGNDAYVQEDNDLDTGGIIFGSFWLYATPQDTWTMADNDLFAVFQLMSSGPTSDGVIWLEDNAGTMEMGIAETIASNANTQVFPMAQWNHIEWTVSVTGNLFDAWLNGTPFTQISGGSIATIIHGRLGVMSEDAGTTAGRLFFDEFIVDDARIGTNRQRFPSGQYWVTHNQHCYLGPGRAIVTVTGTSTDASAILYDTDNALNGSALSRARIAGVARTADDENSRPVEVNFTRGLYVELAGTNTQAFVQPLSTIWGSEGAAKSYLSHSGRVAIP